MGRDDPSIPEPNKIVHGRPYWFFKHLEGVEPEVIDNWSPSILRAAARISGFEVMQGLRAFIRQFDYDAVISHSYNSGFALSMLRSMFRVQKPPHYVIDVGSLNGGVENPLQIALIRFSLRSVAGLIYHSMINEAFYLKHFEGTRRAFISFGSDPECLRPSHARPEKEYALSIGYAFRDYDTLIRAWSEIDFPLKIAGISGLDLKGTRKVSLLGMLPPPELYKHVNEASFVVLPISNVKYSIGQMTLLQCMAMEKAVIVSRSYGVLDYCRDGENCLMYECGDDRDLAEKVHTVMNNPDMARAISARARSDVVTLFNEKKMAERIFEFISARGGVSHRSD